MEAKRITEKNGYKQVTENIVLCPDGVYRWTYALDMRRNPTILFTVWKVLGISFGAVFLFIFILTMFDSAMKPWEAFLYVGKLFFVLVGIFLVLSLIGYAIVAALYGWKYIVHFEMTEEYVRHITEPMQRKKAERLGQLTVLAGILAKQPGAVAAGRAAAAKSTSTSVFKNVETVKVRRRRHTIHVNQLLEKNQVYAEDADFDFVERFITERCTKAKLK